MLRAGQTEIEELIIELERRRSDGLASLRKATGRELTEAALRERMDERLRELLRPVVAEVLDERVRRAEPSPATNAART